MSADKQTIFWPGWETIRVIGRGSFGAVYEIHKLLPGETEPKMAALKVISIPQEKSEIEQMYDEGLDMESITGIFQSYRDDVIKEFTTMRNLCDCANVVNCDDDVRFIQHDDGIGWDIFIKMELLTPLTKSLSGEISEDTVVTLAEHLCTALAACEQHHIIHRDIKPQNIFVSSNGIYKLGDFGVARTVERTMAATTAGTPPFMAPEVYHHRPYNATADIYSLGLVLYWLLNEQRLPFLPLPPEKLTLSMKEAATKRRMDGESLPPPAHGSKGLQRIVLTACAYDPKDRYTSAGDMLAALESYKEGETIQLFDHDKAEKRRKEQERLAKEKAERLKKEKAEQARGEQEEQERLAREKAERLARERAEREQHEKLRQKDPVINRFSGKHIMLGIAAMLALVLVIGYFTVHVWTDATCTAPKTCTICGTTQGTTVAHNWEEATCEKPKTCPDCGATEGTAAAHSWEDATCEKPKTCPDCGATEGTAAAHSWEDATCTSPMTCSICGETTGDVAHQWIAATYFQPKTCELCGATEGSRLIPDPVFINELDYCDKYGKLWTMSNQKPDYYVHTNVNDAEDYKDMNTPGHTTGPVHDYLGNSYTYGLHIDGDEYSAYFISYNIGGIYSTFTGAYCMSPDMDGDSRASKEKYFEVYGDGILLFRSVEISKGSAAKTFNIDVSGVEILTIRYPKTSGPSRIATIFDGKLS